MKTATLTEPFPKQDPTDIIGVDWRTKVLVRYGLDPIEAFHLALFMSGMELAAERLQERMIARSYRP